MAPGMQPVARRESAGEKIEIVRAGAHDTCIRVAFEAKAPVVARMLDSAGEVLASSASPAVEGVLGELGPICIRRGESLGVDTDGSPTAQVRWVAMASEPISSP
jgi:hypothetical protein